MFTFTRVPILATYFGPLPCLEIGMFFASGFSEILSTMALPGVTNALAHTHTHTAQPIGVALEKLLLHVRQGTIHACVASDIDHLQDACTCKLETESSDTL